MVRGVRAKGDVTPEWNCGKLASAPVYAMMIFLFGAAAVYAVAGSFGLLPAGW